MKKLLIIFFALTAVWLVVHPQKAFADYDEGQHEIEEQLEDMLADYDIDWSYGDISGMTFTELRDKISESTKERLAAPLRLLGILISVILFTAAVRGTSENILGSSGQIFDTICVVTAAAAITPAVFTAYSSTLEAVERLSGFMLVFVPVFAGITIAAGGAVTGGTYSMLILGASTAFAAAVRSFLMPVLSVMAALSVSGSVFPERSVETQEPAILQLQNTTGEYGLGQRCDFKMSGRIHRTILLRIRDTAESGVRKFSAAYEGERRTCNLMPFHRFREEHFRRIAFVR